MGTDVTLADHEREIREPAMRPYAPGWLHELGERIERLPGPTWVAYALIGVTAALFWHAQQWILGTVPFGTIDRTSVYWGILPVGLLWIARDLERAAGAAFDAFRPALPLPATELARLRYELTTVPGRQSLVIGLVSLAFTVLTYVLDPVRSMVVGLPGPLVVVLVVLQAFNVAILIILIYQLLRQMRQVHRTLARSVVVDVFQPGPLHAFSRLTSRTGIEIVLLTFASLLFIPVSTLDIGDFLLGAAPYLVVPPILAAIAFVVPLYGLHGRLVDEKERLQGEAEQRLKGVLAEINGTVDSNDLSRADELSKTLASMLQQRDVLAKLRTWPWSTATLRGFVTAIFLPLGLFIAQQVLARFV